MSVHLISGTLRLKVSKLKCGDSLPYISHYDQGFAQDHIANIQLLKNIYLFETLLIELSLVSCHEKSKTSRKHHYYFLLFVTSNLMPFGLVAALRCNFT